MSGKKILNEDPSDTDGFWIVILSFVEERLGVTVVRTRIDAYFAPSFRIPHGGEKIDGRLRGTKVFAAGNYQHGTLQSLEPFCADFVEARPINHYTRVYCFRIVQICIAQPASQAAYAHYGLVCIHPFADGNGRVARALASCFTYKAIRMPIVIFTEHKKPYWTVLVAADAGNYQIFMDFMVARSLETIELVSESLRSASQPEVKDSIAAIHHLYITRGGYTYEQIDHAGTNLMKALQAAVNQASSKLSTSKIAVNCGLQYGVQYNVPAGYRAPTRTPTTSGGQMLTFVLQSSYPASAKIASNYCLALPKNAAGDDDIQLITPQLPVPDIFPAPIDQVIPEISSTLQIRLNMFAERIVKESFARLRTEAEKAGDLNRR